MARIIEDFVSFEVAKLLKEKGFTEECVYLYDRYKESESYHIRHTGGTCNDEEYPYEYSMPTLQMAMKWLREVHNIMVSPYALSLGYYFEIFDLTDRDITGCKTLYKIGIPNKENVLNTYE